MPNNRMMKRWILCALTLGLIGAAVPQVADAGSVGSSRIVSVVSHSYGSFWVTLESPIQGSPGCNSSGRFSISMHTPEGRSLAATAMLAKAMGSSVTAVGWNTCTIWPDSEDLQHIQVY